MKTVSVWLTLFLFAVTSHAEERAIQLTLPELRTLLATPVTRGEIEKKFGQPLNKCDPNWGFLMYKTSGNKFVSFFFKGPHITSACIGKEEVAGFSPPTHEMSVSLDDKKQKLRLDGVVFEDVDQFKIALKKLPEGAIVEWQISCDASSMLPGPQIKGLVEFANDAGLYLIIHPAG